MVHQLLVNAGDVNILGGSELTTRIKENAEPLVVASKETGLEVNADKKYKYVVMSQSEYRTKLQYKE